MESNTVVTAVTIPMEKRKCRDGLRRMYKLVPGGILMRTEIRCLRGSFSYKLNALCFAKKYGLFVEKSDVFLKPIHIAEVFCSLSKTKGAASGPITSCQDSLLAFADSFRAILKSGTSCFRCNDDPNALKD